MNRKLVSLFPLLVSVCLLSFAAPASTHPDTPENNSTSRPDYLSPLEKELLDEMNLARTEPQKYAVFVEEYKRLYEGKRLLRPGRKPLVTFDGVEAVDEAIGFLRAAKALPPFEISKGICQAARDHANDLGLKGIMGHKGSDGSLPNARLDRYGRWESTIGETILYEVSTAREMVIALIIDDGVPTRGHRNNIFNPDYRIAGLSISAPATTAARGVIDYTGGFQEKAGWASQR